MSHPDPTRLKILAPPPRMWLDMLLLGFAIQTISPIRLFSTTYSHIVLGSCIFALSAAFARWAFVVMRKMGTTANPDKPSEALTTSGPFRFSRNPAYVAMTGLYMALCFIGNAGWPLILLGPLLLIMYWGVIWKEENYLSEKFGQSYLVYKSEVRRWL